MGLPLLKDMLPEDLSEAFKPAPLDGADSAASVSTDAFSEHVAVFEQKYRDLRSALNEFVDTLHHAGLGEDDFESAAAQVSNTENDLMETIGRYAQTLRQFRSEIKALRNAPRKFALLRVCESQLKIYGEIRAMFDSAKDEIETIRDSLLVREAHELAATTFWGDDDD